MSVPFIELLQQEIDNMQSSEDAIPLIRCLSIDSIKRLLKEATQIGDTELHRSLALKSLSINKIIPDDVFMSHILSYLPLLLPSCKANIVNKHWKKMCDHCINIHYNKLKNTFEEQERASNNTYNDDCNDTWIIYNLSSGSRKIRLTKIEQDLNFKLFQQGASQIKDGDRIILYPIVHEIRHEGGQYIMCIEHNISIIGVYPKTIFKVKYAKNCMLTAHPCDAVFQLGRYSFQYTKKLNIFIKNIECQGITMKSFCKTASSANLSIDNCNIRYQWFGIMMNKYGSSLTINNTSFHGHGPCIKMYVYGPCSINITNSKCFVDYGLLHCSNKETGKRESFVIGPTTNLELSMISTINGGCISIWKLPYDIYSALGVDENTDFKLHCEGNSFESAIYPIGTKNMNHITIDKSHTIKNNKWNYYKPQIITNFKRHLMCSSSKSGGTKCIMPTDNISPSHVCDGCGDQVHPECLYQEDPKLCYMCYVMEFQKSTTYIKNKDIPVSAIYPKYKILDDVCQHQFSQMRSAEDHAECVKCNEVFNDDAVRWHCGTDYTSVLSNNGHPKTKWYCHMTICQQCFDQNFRQ